MKSQHMTDWGERGGGSALIFGMNDNIKLLENGNTRTIEYAIWRYTIRNKPIHIIGIYHLPPNAEHNTISGVFMDNITGTVNQQATSVSK